MNKTLLSIGVLVLLAGCRASESSTAQAPALTGSPVSMGGAPAATSAPLLTRTAGPTPTLRPTATSAFLQVGSTWVRPADGMVMVFVPSGGYSAGNPPQRRMMMPAFWIDQTEVTNGMYALCVEAGACKPPPETSSLTREHYYDDPQYADYPVIRVTFEDARAYCAWAEARLPLWIEWEEAARGTDGRLYPWGDEFPSCELVNSSHYIDDNNWPRCVGDTTPVGSYQGGRSPYFAYDMSGNVEEWVADVCDYYPEVEPALCSMVAESTRRQVRGGHFGSSQFNIDVTFVQNHTVDEPSVNIGFRCVLVGS